MAKKAGSSSGAFGFFQKGSPNKKLAGPVGKERKDVKQDKKGKPDRPLNGPTGMVFPIPKKGSPKRGAAAPRKNG